MTPSSTLGVRRIFQSKWPVIVVLFFVTAHVALLIHGAGFHFPNIDEVAHLPSGVSHWEFERFDLYRVNPPLVRVVAGFPAWIGGVEYDWGYYVDDVGMRPEFVIGNDHIRRVGIESASDFYLPRLFCIPFTLIGVAVLVYWVHTTLGIASSVLTAAYWCCCPNILAHAQTIVPDVGCLSVGIVACYLSWRYFVTPSIVSASLAGIGLGFALLTKLTWVAGFVSLPLAVALCCLLLPRETPNRSLYKRSLDGCFFVVITLLVLNAGYLFEGFGQKLGEFQFCSEMLGGPGSSRRNLGNRFEGCWLEQVPVPVPKNFLLGIDFLKHEVEEKKWSFLLGEWKQGSWPYYYVVTTLLKTPEGMLIGAFLGGSCWLVLLVKRRLSMRDGSMMIMLVVPAMVVFASVSQQGGFNHHHRYVLNIYPPMYALAAFLVSKPLSECIAGRLASINRRCIVLIGIALCAFSAGSSLRTTPHFLSYFNSLSGGSQNGWRMLGYSNVDWGQDLLLVHDWIEKHPECTPIYVECVHGQIDSTTAGFGSVPQLPDGASWRDLQGERDQWFLICVNRLNHPLGSMSWSYLKELKPIDRIAYSHHVYLVPARKD